MKRKGRLLLCLALMALPGMGRADEPTLSRRQIVRLADAAARHAGYDLERFGRPALRIVATCPGRVWGLFYSGKADKDGQSVIGNYFIVYVDGHDRRTSISPGR